MNLREANSVASDRGIGFQAIGFTIVGLGSVAVLETTSGSGFWWYDAFVLATTKLYWAFILPLAALFDWGRKMFESGRAIREAKKAQIRAEGVQEGILHVKTLLEENNIELPPDVAEKVFGNSKNGKR